MPKCPRLLGRGFALLALLATIVSFDSNPAVAQDRFEVTSIKAVRPTLVNTITALQQKDAGKAKAAFEAYDSSWNGVEVYVNTRSRPMYQLLEHEYQARIAKALETPNPDTVAVLADA